MRPRRRRPRPGQPRHRVVAGTAIVLALAVAGCSGREADRADEVIRPGPVPSGDEEGVTVTGRVHRVVDSHVFEIAADGSGGGAESVLVLALGGERRVVGEQVEVTGRVRPFRRTVLEAEFALRFAPAVDAVEGRSCILARRVQTTSPPTGSSERPGGITPGAGGKEGR